MEIQRSHFSKSESSRENTGGGGGCCYLQDEDEVVDGFALLVDVVMERPLVVFVELDLLDHIGVAQDSQQHFVRDLILEEHADLCRTTKNRSLSVTKPYLQNKIMSDIQLL